MSALVSTAAPTLDSTVKPKARSKVKCDLVNLVSKAGSKPEPKQVLASISTPDPTKKASDRLIDLLYKYKPKCKQSTESNDLAKNKPKRTQYRPIPKRRRLQISSKCDSKIPCKRKKIAKMEEDAKSGAKPQLRKICEKEDKNESYGYLELTPLRGPDIPSIYFNIESGKDASFLQDIKEMINDSSSSPEQYTKAYRALLFLEEAAEVINLRNYNQKSIALTYQNVGRLSRRLFEIEIDVSYLFLRIFWSYCFYFN